ncbi:flagellar basal body L-ring protein FlgH [Sphingomonas montanisoli]|uniref:Flagellar L-ring protein n=2 Tax=Sphingomonas montanisoli TaxID=2606412 RepID=A0A5D9C103_9SPHN|nr:flagellar basal body L-ring protein FlgH [Sphingomonas montanisoli]TZG25103.1 flagellar basal body L-ring protein FlgH [Sphingomonas montanisoli]
MSTRTSKRDMHAFTALGLVAAMVMGSALEAPAHARKAPRVSEYEPSYAAVPMPAQANGSIYQASMGYNALTNGARAAMVGDIVTILLVERTQAVKANSASTDRSGNVGFNPPTTGWLGKLIDKDDVTTSGGGKFDGKGAAAQSNQLNGEISVTIARVYPNGTMLVRGEKLLTLNRGDENIAITGLIRAADIGPDNRVPSTRVADARITYSGKGEIARASRQGWINRFFSILSPF